MQHYIIPSSRLKGPGHVHSGSSDIKQNYMYMYVCMYVYFDSVVHYTCYVNVGQIKLIQIHPEHRPTQERELHMDKKRIVTWPL